MAEQKYGVMINVSSMATYSAITRVLGYSMAKSSINIFTQWMAMEMALKFSDKIRVNAIAPGFFIGDQNRAVLINPDGSYTERSKKVMAPHTDGTFRRHLRTERNREIPLFGPKRASSQAPSFRSMADSALSVQYNRKNEPR